VRGKCGGLGTKHIQRGKQSRLMEGNMIILSLEVGLIDPVDLALFSMLANSVTQAEQPDVFLRLASRKTPISLSWSLSGESQTILGFLEFPCWEVIYRIRVLVLLFGILNLLRIVVGRRGGLLEGMESTPIVQFFSSFGSNFKKFESIHIYKLGIFCANL
jgi:hypothetical protein